MSTIPGQIFSHPGLMTAYGTPFLPFEFTGTGGRIFWVGNRSGLPVGNGSNPDYPFSTINTALAACTSGRGDVVYVLPGHAEDISAADMWSALVAGTKVIGLGSGSDRPTFSYTLATSTILMNVANVLFDNMIFIMDTGTVTATVADGIVVSASGCTIRGCNIRAGTDANSNTTIAVRTTAGGDEFTFENNLCYQVAITAEGTTFLRLVGADRAKIVGNYIKYATDTAGVGPVQCLTTASTDVVIANNYIWSAKAASTACITGDVAGCNGAIRDNRLRNELNTSLAHIVITGADWSLFENYGVNDDNETGTLLGVVSA